MVFVHSKISWCFNLILLFFPRISKGKYNTFFFFFFLHIFVIPLGQYLHSFHRTGALEITYNHQSQGKQLILYCDLNQSLTTFWGIQWVFQLKDLALPSYLLTFTDNTESITFDLSCTWLASNFLHLWHTMTIFDAVKVCDYTEKHWQVDSEWPLISCSPIAWLCCSSLCYHSNTDSISFSADFIKRKRSCLSVKKKKSCNCWNSMHLISYF